jgi:NADH-quinone oxidoreductase subunit G
MDDHVNITVDGRAISAPKGALLWEICRAEGIDIPIFCYHTKLGAVGACRTCLVEQEGAKGPITACSTRIADGMVIRTRSPVAQKAQRGIFEFLLANHPLDCPICDRGGECPLQDQTFAYGPGASRYVEPKRHHVKPVVLGPTIELDRERCVLCWRCVRFCVDIAEDKSIVLLDRGDHTVVGTYQNEPYVNQFSGNVIELCPVGALTSRKQRFTFRPWELQNRPSICPHCPVGCNVNVSVRKNDTVIRFLSRDNPDVDDSWLCDRGRFAYDFVSSPDRLTSPMIRRGGAFVQTSWAEALEFIASRVHRIREEHGPGAIAGVASPRLTNEDLFVFRRFMRDVLNAETIDHFPRSAMALDAEQQDALRRLDHTIMAIKDLETVKTILLLGADPSAREPVLELRIRKAVNQYAARLVDVNSSRIALSEKASAEMTYLPEDFAGFTWALAAAVSSARNVVMPMPAKVSLQTLMGSKDIGDFARDYLAQGPVALIYDDGFPGIADQGEALLAVDALVGALGADGVVGTIPLLDDCNSLGARDIGVLPPGDGTGTWGRPLVDRLLDPSSPTRAAFILGSNLVRGPEAATLSARLRAMDLVVVHELRMSETAALADVVLPAASFAEKHGTFTNTERRVQMVSPVVPTPGIARPDWEILVDLSQSFDAPLDYTSPEDIWNDLRRNVESYAGLSHDDIGPRGVRPAALQLA